VRERERECVCVRERPLVLIRERERVLFHQYKSKACGVRVKGSGSELRPVGQDDLGGVQVDGFRGRRVHLRSSQCKSIYSAHS